MTLPRAGWIGTWKYGGSLWTGDIGSTFPIRELYFLDLRAVRLPLTPKPSPFSVATQIKTILSAQLTGFAWTTVDGGGYCGGDSQSPAYRETQLRWMQVSATLPIMRQHGQRDQ